VTIWTREIDEQLVEGWQEGATTQAIAARLSAIIGFDISKNAVVGRAHRLKLPPRVSPIRRKDVSPAEAGRPIGCRYIAGDPREPNPYCGETPIPGSDYCAPHHALCYRVVPRQGDAA
jgi:GcrA cell cycle regulator